MERQHIETVLVEYLGDRPDVAAAYLYGSVATGAARPDSDVDVGILYRTTPPPTLLGQPYGDEAELSARVGRPVQIVVMNTAPVDLVHRILRDGALIVERDASARIAFEVRSRNQYYDLLPVLLEYRKRATV
ncbi:MAG TPA: nucleotidyltransferase domain-containing protein [Polyangiaceae bacterium]|nr:nucleotidyltransferase domain-containing protein [Polyangiaceae bacterium]